MRQAPFDKKRLVHKIQWYPKHLLNSNDESYVIDRVMIHQSPTYAWDNTGSQQTNFDNFRLIVDCQNSVGMPSDKVFAVGDTIKILKGPIFPILLSIVQVFPKPDLDGTHTHHYEIYLR